MYLLPLFYSSNPVLCSVLNYSEPHGYKGPSRVFQQGVVAIRRDVIAPGIVIIGVDSLSQIAAC